MSGDATGMEECARSGEEIGEEGGKEREKWRRLVGYKLRVSVRCCLCCCVRRRD